MIVANLPYLCPLFARVFKLGSVAQNTTEPRSQFTLQAIRNVNNFDPAGSKEKIASNAGPPYSDNELDLSGGGKGISEATVFSGALDDEEPDSDTRTPRIMKTVSITQYRREAT